LESSSNPEYSGTGENAGERGVMLLFAFVGLGKQYSGFTAVSMSNPGEYDVPLLRELETWKPMD
jgi:hypothetical protein